jgi:Family of unknown function (DUF5677)
VKVTPHEEKCQQALGGLETWINKLLDLANETIEGAECLDDDHLGFMALCFLSRQIDHIQSIVTLVPNRDAILIARSMIEGLCQLLWAAQKPMERPLKWRAFAYIHDWRLQKVKSDRGESIDPNQQKFNELGIQMYGKLFYTKEARSAINQNQPLPPDPYHQSWKCGTQIKQICDCVEAGDLHKEIYSSFSDWHHWGTAGIGEALSWNANKGTFSSSSSSNSAMALATGFSCLLQTLELTNEHLSFSRELQIASIRDGYIKWHQDRDILSTSSAVSV